MSTALPAWASASSGLEIAGKRSSTPETSAPRASTRGSPMTMVATAGSSSPPATSLATSSGPTPHGSPGSKATRGTPLMACILSL